MHLGELVSNYRKNKKMTMDVFSERSGISKAYISMLEKNINPTSGKKISPSVQVIKQVSETIGMDFYEIINLLDPEMSVTKEETNAASSLTKKALIYDKFKLYENPVSAGLGSWLDEGTEYNYVEVEQDGIDAEFALKVRGDSMSPMYIDGDIVFVKSLKLIEPGQIGVFLINGEGYFKQWQGNRLLSLNPQYEPITIDENDEFMAIGKVVDKMVRGTL